MLLNLLPLYGGSFGYDFKIAEVLKSKSSNKINKVFTIEFPSREVMNAFFPMKNTWKLNLAGVGRYL